MGSATARVNWLAGMLHFRTSSVMTSFIWHSRRVWWPLPSFITPIKFFSCSRNVSRYSKISHVIPVDDLPRDRSKALKTTTPEDDAVAIKEAVQTAKGWTHATLAKLGIRDIVTVKVKRFAKSPNWLAMYRGGTQFSRGGGNPIFWVNEGLLDVMRDEGVEDHQLLKVVYDSLLHEYGHVVWEWARMDGRAVGGQGEAWSWIQDRVVGTLAGIWDDEEDFAEGFVQFALNGLGKHGPVIEMFVKDSFG